MKKGMQKITAFALAAVLTACGAGGQSPDVQDTQEETAETVNEDIVRAQVFADMPQEQKNWMGGLTEQQRIADFKSLCDGLRENYPYLTLAKRQVGADIDELEKNYLDRVKECENDDAYYYVLSGFVGEFAFTGHLELWGRRYESELESLKMNGAVPELKKHLEPYIAVLDNPRSRSTYAAMTAFYQEVERQVQERLGESEEEAAAWGGDDVPANVETKILEPGKVAYVSIQAFDHGKMEDDRGILLPFYESVRDYDDLILDITENPGGSMLYFNELVVAPLTKERLIVPSYQMFKDGDDNRIFLRMEEGIASGLYQPVSELPALPCLDQENVRDCTWFMREDYTVEPAGDGFDGKIGLLVSEKNYSSSEYAAMFAKASGFATLVGEVTGGDGIGTDPGYLILSESGLVVQYSPMYGVTADGTGSEECGTEQDIPCQEGKSALETCLACIQRE